MKLIIEIPDDDYELVQKYIYPQRVFYELVHGTPIPDNATNGECVGKLFCKGICRTSVRTNVSVEFKRDWWYAKYQKGGKE